MESSLHILSHGHHLYYRTALKECKYGEAHLIACSNLDMVIISLMWWLAQSHSKHDRCCTEKEQTKILSLNPLLIYCCQGKASPFIDSSYSDIRKYKLENLLWHLAEAYFLQCHSTWMHWAKGSKPGITPKCLIHPLVHCVSVRKCVFLYIWVYTYIL